MQQCSSAGWLTLVLFAPIFAIVVGEDTQLRGVNCRSHYSNLPLRLGLRAAVEEASLRAEDLLGETFQLERVIATVCSQPSHKVKNLLTSGAASSDWSMKHLTRESLESAHTGGDASSFKQQVERNQAT